jgi:hypothetical protein
MSAYAFVSCANTPVGVGACLWGVGGLQRGCACIVRRALCDALASCTRMQPRAALSAARVVGSVSGGACMGACCSARADYHAVRCWRRCCSLCVHVRRAVATAAALSPQHDHSPTSLLFSNCGCTQVERHTTQRQRHTRPIHGMPLIAARRALQHTHTRACALRQHSCGGGSSSEGVVAAGTSQEAKPAAGARTRFCALT